MGIAINIGQTGLLASSKQLDVIGNNLANSSTVGFKASSTLFANMMNQGLSSMGALSVGQGVGVASLPTDYSQGSFETTGNNTDMAIDGEGFFLVEDPAGASYYTRAGAFHIDNNSNLVDIRGYKVEGYSMTNDTLSNVPTDIVLQKSMDASTTTEVSFGANLDASATAAVAATATTPAIPGDTFEVSETVYDSLGASHTLSLTFEKTDASTWDVTGTFDGDTGVTISTTTVGFDETGALTSPAGDATITIAPTDATILGDATIGNGGVLNWLLTTDTSRSLTGYASDSTVRSLYADGFAAGELSSLSVDNKGIISGVYTNGQSLELYQVALATFQDQTSLIKNGNYYLQSTGSGAPIIKPAGSGGVGNIQSSSLEASNTDVSKEFIRMIAAQRAYQANAKVITTADDMLTELMNIKR